jgi:hypothetical protein
MFKDDAFQVRSTVDKRGRKVKGGRKNEDMRRYYRLQGEEEARQALQKGMTAAGSEQAAAADDRNEQDVRQQQQRQKAAGSAQQPQREAQVAAPAGKPRHQQAAAARDAEASSDSSEGDDDGLDSQEREAQQRWARMRCEPPWPGTTSSCAASVGAPCVVGACCSNVTNTLVLHHVLVQGPGRP